ncbi:hypothetical protein [Sphingopyxis macrogoltabida]|uniref:hypothetical protein n=1 Tax=Sphingopyxis macrogoltabida TaxID=33050 RepID=UPI0011AB69C3|nr:hypothetical protein [Sphingopyxis macrogoltabida]
MATQLIDYYLCDQLRSMGRQGRLTYAKRAKFGGPRIAFRLAARFEDNHLHQAIIPLDCGCRANDNVARLLNRWAIGSVVD